MPEQQVLVALAAAAGIEPERFLSPKHLARDILDGAKRLSRYLRKDRPQIGQRKMLEHLGRAGGMPDWHALQTTANRLLEAHPAIDPHPALLALRHAYPLAHAAKSLTWHYQAGTLTCIASFADRLAKELAASGGQMRDTFAKVMGSDDWKTLNSRSPEIHPAPFYEFHLTKDGRGVLSESQACAELRLEMREGWSVYSRENAGDQRHLKQRLWLLLEERPDFLIGWSSLIEMSLNDGDTERAEQLLVELIARIEALIPKGFRRKFANEGFGSIVYQSSVYDYMKLLGNKGDFSGAIRAARKLKRIDERDSYGIDETLTLLFSLTGQHEKAEPHLKRLLSRRDDVPADTALLLAHSFLLRKEPEAGVTWLLFALYKLPMIRPLLGGQQYRHDDPKLIRVSVPDTDEMYVRVEWVERNMPPVIAMCNLILRRKEVKDAERQLEALWHAAKDANDSWAMEQWFRSLYDQASALAKRIVATM